MSKTEMLRQYELADEIEIAARRLDVWAEAGPMFEHRHSPTAIDTALPAIAAALRGLR